MINARCVLSKALLNEFHTSVLCNCVFVITFKSGARGMSTGISGTFKHVELYNKRNLSRISALNAANTNAVSSLSRVNKLSEIVKRRRRVCKRTAYRLVKVQ